MEAVPRLPMISFELKTSTENASFSQPLKQYISQCYGEDPESYNKEIHNLESLRCGAVRPSIDVEGIQLLKKYYCQLHFLKSRFPMEELQPAAVYFSWKDNYSTLACSIPDIRFELMCILYNIGALHTQLGAADQRTTPDGMKIACTHFQCAAWAFQVLKQNYYQMITYISAVEIVYFMEMVCLAQAQECILEKSMMDNRKATIIAKVAVQVVDYYKRAQMSLQGGFDENNYSDYVQVGTFKEWVKYLNFKITYHKCISLLFQGQQAEELQKMGERVALYQAAVEQLEAARKLSTGLENKQDIAEALAFTSDVVEGKKKAARNENDFIYHEEVPNKDTFQEVKGASLVKGIPFNITDAEVSGQDIFAKLIPMETHEASSLYSEKKAELLRKYGELIESKDQKLAEFMSSMQIDFLNDIRQATGIPQDIVDRAAALSAKPTAIQELVSCMTKLSNSYHEVESLLNEIQDLLTEEGQHEKEYQKSIGERPPSIIATDLSREAAKYREAHGKADQSNQNLHRAMVTHVGNLKTLSQPLTQLQQQIPALKMPDPNIDEASLKEVEMLLAKVEEMKLQRSVLWAQLRDALHTDDITSVIVTKEANESLDELFRRELDKHKHLTSLIEQNASAQDNIIKAFIDAYAKFSTTRRYLQSIITKRQSTIHSLISSYDSYDDLLSKAIKGVEFYSKLETNVTKLLQRIKSSCKVQQEEREQMLSKVVPQLKPEPDTFEPNTPKLKDYLDSLKSKSPKTVPNVMYTASNYAGSIQNSVDSQVWPPGVRPTPVGSEINDSSMPLRYDSNYPDNYYTQNKNSYPTSTKYQLNNSNTLDQQASSLNVSNKFGTSDYHPTMNASNSTVDSIDTTLERRLNSMTVNDKDGGTSITYQPNNFQDYRYYNYASYGSNYANTGDTQTGTFQANTTPTFSEGQMNAMHPQVSGYATANNVGPLTSTAMPGNVSYSSQFSQYIPTHYQQMNYSIDNKVNPLHVQNTSNHLYASGYATSQNFINSDMATVQSGRVANYGMTAPSEQPASIFSYGESEKAGGANQYSVSRTDLSMNGMNNPSIPSELPMSDHSTSQNRMMKNHESTLGTGQSADNSFQVQNAYSRYDQYQFGENAMNPQGNSYSSNPQGQNVSQIPPENFTHYSNFQKNSGIQNNIMYPSGEIVNPYDMHQQNLTSFGQPSSMSQYSEGYVGAGSLVFQNQINPSSMYTQAGMSYDFNLKNTSSSSGGLTSPQCFPDSNTQNSVGNFSYQINPAPPVVETRKESSTIDLLSGLDFTISQVPLEPEQKIAPEVKKVNTAVSEQQTVAKHSSVPDVHDTRSDPKVTSHVQHFQLIKSEPIDSEAVKKLFRHEIEKYEKFVDVLCHKTLNGPTTLDLKWKEIQDSQEIISVARCYPMKNRYPDILPYDHSRVILNSTTDDYINASYIKDISPFVPPIIVTQAPLQSTMVEFWTMILEQRVEFVMCLLNDNEMDGVYWPTEKGKDKILGSLVISLQSVITKTNWIERILVVSIPEKKEYTTIVHLQFTEWPGSLFPVSPDPFVTYIKEFIRLYQQQQLHSNPIVIHCSSGIGRSGVACVLLFSILESANSFGALPDLVSLTNKITSFRKNILRDREHLKFSYQAFLSYMKQIISNNANKIDIASCKLEENCSVDNSAINDPLSTLDPFWASRRKAK